MKLLIFLVLMSAACTPYLGEQPSRPRPSQSEWDQAGRRALRSPKIVDSRFRGNLRFMAGRPAATGYRLQMHRGQKITIELDRRSSADVVTEIFEEIGPGEPFFRLVHTAARGSAEITFEARTDGPHVVRITPEPYASGTVMVSLAKAASLTFPVAGRTARAINSYFGEARDGGKRDHEGIDIFAPAGTSVVAVADGSITTVNTTSRGGNVIWQYDAARNVTYYYAHLEGQSVKRGDRVKAGDVMGTVGNTGNARGTSAHLHFAVYKPGNVAIDPVPFLYDPIVQMSEPSTKASD